MASSPILMALIESGVRADVCAFLMSFSCSLAFGKFIASSSSGVWVATFHLSDAGSRYTPASSQVG